LAIFRADLRSPRAHGFYRFFAFEALLGLVLLNARAWLRAPLSPRQVLSWLCLLASAGLALHGFSLLRRLGRPDGPIEHTTQLVTSGAYRYVRHPLYSSLFWLGLGAFLKDPSWLGTALLLGLAAALLATARVEERENLARFGEAYAAYCRRTRRFVPFVF
jgi:protein-S-isoprenylcysteine O-methyltransferase Ste14